MYKKKKNLGEDEVFHHVLSGLGGVVHKGELRTSILNPQKVFKCEKETFFGSSLKNFCEKNQVRITLVERGADYRGELLTTLGRIPLNRLKILNVAHLVFHTFGLGAFCDFRGGGFEAQNATKFWSGISVQSHPTNRRCKK